MAKIYKHKMLPHALMQRELPGKMLYLNSLVATRCPMRFSNNATVRLLVHVTSVDGDWQCLHFSMLEVPANPLSEELAEARSVEVDVQTVLGLIADFCR